MIEYITFMHIVFFACILGSGYTSYSIGVKSGSEKCIEILLREELILEVNGELLPNLAYYNSKDGD